MAATFVLHIKADPSGVKSGTKQVERDLDRIKSKALDVNRAIRQVFGVFAIRELMTGLLGLVDGYVSLSNKLNVVAKDQKNLNGLMNATFKVAQETRSSWAATAQMYSRMALNSKQLGASQQELINFTKSLNQAIIIGGATATESAAGLLQLSQGMASGALKGDELRAVLEQLPIVADVIGKKMGATRGELRKLGTESKITGKIILEAFKEAAPELEKQFGKTIPTIGQSFEMLRNSAMKFFGEAGVGSGVVQALAASIKFLADNMETLGKVLIAVGQVLLGLMILRTIQQLVVALFTVISAHPLTAFIVAIGVVITLLRQFGEELDAGHDGVTKISTVLRLLWEDLKALGSGIYEFLGMAWKELTVAFNTGLETDGIEFSLKSVLMFIASFVDLGIGLFRFLKETVITIFGGVPLVIGEAFIDVGKRIAEFFGKMLNGIISALNTIEAYAPGGRNRAADRTNAWEKSAQEAAKNYLKSGKDPSAIGASPGGKVFDDAGWQRWKKDYPGQPMATDDPRAQGYARPFTPEEQIKSVNFKDPKVQKMLGIGALNTDAISPVDFSFDNPLAGAAAAGDAKFIEDFRNITKANFAKDYVANLMNHAAAAESNNPATGSVSGKVYTDPTKFQKPGPTKEEENAHEKMLRDLDRLLKKSNEIRKAEMELADAEKFLGRTDVLKELAKRGIDAAAVLSDIKAELADSLFPLQDWTTKQFESASAMHGTNEEYERNRAVLQVMNELYDKGLTITEDVVKQIEETTVAVQERAKMWELEKGILERATSAITKYKDSLVALDAVKSKLTAGQTSAEFRRITDEFTASNDAAYEKWQAKWEKNNPYASGWMDAREKIQADMLNVSGAVSDVITTAFGNIESFILETVDSGKFAWDELIDGMLRSLDKLALKIIETWLLTQALSLSTGGGLNSVPMSVKNGGAHATGGSYVVPGVGGPDSQNVLFRLTPGERVDFTPPGYVPPAPAGASAQAAQGATPMKVSVHNHIDRSELLSAVDTPEGDRVIVNAIRKNAGAVRSLLQR